MHGRLFVWLVKEQSSFARFFMFPACFQTCLGTAWKSIGATRRKKDRFPIWGYSWCKRIDFVSKIKMLLLMSMSSKSLLRIKQKGWQSFYVLASFLNACLFCRILSFNCDRPVCLPISTLMFTLVTTFLTFFYVNFFHEILTFFNFFLKFST